MENNIQNDIFEGLLETRTDTQQTPNIMNDKEVMSNIFDIANEIKEKKPKKQTVKQEKNEEQKSVMRDRLKNAREKKQSMSNRLNELENLLKEKQSNHITISKDEKQEITFHKDEPPKIEPEIELPIPEPPKPQITEPPKPQISNIQKRILKKYFKIY